MSERTNKIQEHLQSLKEGNTIPVYWLHQMAVEGLVEGVPQMNNGQIQIIWYVSDKGDKYLEEDSTTDNQE